MDPKFLAYLRALRSRAKRTLAGVPDLDTIKPDQLAAANRGLEGEREIPDCPGTPASATRQAAVRGARYEKREVPNPEGPGNVEQEFLITDIRWTVGATVRLYEFNFKTWDWDPFDQSLAMGDENVDLSRLNNGAPFLNAHSSYGVSDVLGVHEKAWLQDSDGDSEREGMATIRWSRRENLADVRQDVSDGILRNTSVGFNIDEEEEIEAEDRTDGGTVLLRVATRWSPHENSLVPIGADPDANVVGDGARDFAVSFTRALRAHGAGRPVAEPVAPAATPFLERKSMNKIKVPAGFELRLIDTGTGATELVPCSDAAAECQRTFIVRSNDDGVYTLEIEAGPARSASEAAAHAIVSERERAATIRLRGRAIGDVPDTFVDSMIERGYSVDKAVEHMTRIAAERGDSNATLPGRPAIGVGEDKGERALADGMVLAIMHRANPGGVTKTDGGQSVLLRDKDGKTIRELFEASETAGQFANMSWGRMAEYCAVRNGVSLVRDGSRMGPGQIANVALWADERTHGSLRDKSYRSISGGLSTADFPNIMADAVHRVLRMAYENFPRTYPLWARKGNLKDFRQHSFTAMSEAPDLLPLGPGGEIESGSMRDSGEAIKLSEFARSIGIQRKTIVNDDLGALGRIPIMFAMAAAALETSIVYGVLTNNALMADNNALFSAAHGNLGTTAQTINKATLQEIRTLMRKQKGQSSEEGGTGRGLKLAPGFLIHPTDLEGDSDDVFNEKLFAATVANGVPEKLRRLYTPICEPELDDTSDSEFYSTINPAVSPVDTVLYGYLEGEEGLQSDTRVGFDVLGVEMRFYMTFMAKALDWVGMVKMPGAP